MSSSGSVSTKSESPDPDPNPEQRIFYALTAGVPIKVNIYLKTAHDWDAFSTEFKDFCRQQNVEPYVFEGKTVPSEPVEPIIPGGNNTTAHHTNGSNQYVPSSLDIIIFEAQMCRYDKALKEYNTVMNNLHNVRQWLMLHMSPSLYHVCSPTLTNEIKDENPNRWYSNLCRHIFVPHQEKMLLQRARDKYKHHFRRLRKRRTVTKRYLRRWLEDLTDIVSDGKRHGVPEAVDATRWFGDLVKNGVIDAVYRTLPRVAMAISEVDGQIKRGDADSRVVIRGIQIALEVNGMESSDVVSGDCSIKSWVAEGKKNVSFADDEVNSEDISPGTSILNTGVRTRRAGNGSSSELFEPEGKGVVRFEDPEVDSLELWSGTEIPRRKPRTSRTKKGGSSEIGSHAPGEKDVLEGEASGTKTESLLIQHVTEGKDSMEVEAPKEKKEVTLEEPEVSEVAKDVITVAEENKVNVEEYHSCAKREETEVDRNDDEVRGKKKKSLRGWLRRFGRRGRTRVEEV